MAVIGTQDYEGHLAISGAFECSINHPLLFVMWPMPETAELGSHGGR